MKNLYDKITGFLEEKMTPKVLNICLRVFFVLSLVPLIWIGLYNAPGADDFSIGLQAHLYWEKYHNVFAALYGGAVRGYDDYMHWMGYFTSNYLMAIPPCVISEKLYVLTTPLMLSAIIFPTGYLFKQIMVRALKLNKYLADSVIVIMLFVIIQCMISGVEAFYWYCGAANYMLTHALSMWFMGLLISIYYDAEKRPVKKIIPKIIGSSVIGFFVGGGNMPTSLNAVIVLFMMWCVFIYQKKLKLKNTRLLIAPTVFNIYGFMCSVLSPGNATREAISTGMNPAKAVLISLYDYFHYCIGEWTKWPVILMIIILAPIFWRMLKNTEFEFKNPVLVVLVGYGLTSAMMTPPLFAVGNHGAGRLQNMFFIMYIMTPVLSEGYVIGYIRHKYDTKIKTVEAENTSSLKFSKNEACLIALSAAFFFYAAGLTLVPHPDFFIGSTAMIDIMNGSAKEYSEALNERVELYRSGEKNVVVKRVPTEPVLLFFTDINGDYNEWIRNAICKYYGLESLEVEEDK